MEDVMVDLRSKQKTPRAPVPEPHTALCDSIEWRDVFFSPLAEQPATSLLTR